MPLTRQCFLSFITMQQQEQDPTNLYISNLPLSMDEQELETMLKPFGQVISTRILRDSNGTSRGVGFARSATSSRMNWSHNPTFLNGVFIHVTEIDSLSAGPFVLSRQLLVIHCRVKPMFGLARIATEFTRAHTDQTKNVFSRNQNSQLHCLIRDSYSHYSHCSPGVIVSPLFPREDE